jgi:hypothetical protein
LKARNVPVSMNTSRRMRLTPEVMIGAAFTPASGA